jgi:hypothetical protein
MRPCTTVFFRGVLLIEERKVRLTVFMHIPHGNCPVGKYIRYCLVLYTIFLSFLTGCDTWVLVNSGYNTIDYKNICLDLDMFILFSFVQLYRKLPFCSGGLEEN